jgi:hypothetical protein
MKKKKIEIIKSVSEVTLEKYWKAALIKQYGHCFFCGNEKKEQLQGHHIVHRNCRLLRWNIRNGLIVCGCTHILNKGLYKGHTCHEYADTPEGEEKIFKAKKNNKLMFDKKFLTEYKLINFKDYLLENGISEKEFLFFQFMGLKAIINEM